MGEKIYWTAVERKIIVGAAADIQAAHPDLAGLPLIREAMKLLPKDRRRRLTGLEQVRWFEPEFETEIRVRAAAASSKVDVMPVVMEKLRLQVEHNAIASKIEAQHEELIGHMARACLQLAGILTELQELNARLAPARGAVATRDGARTPPKRPPPQPISKRLEENLGRGTIGGEGGEMVLTSN